jgi:general secretion pathway protein D
LRGLLQVKADDPRVQVNSAAGLVIVHAKRKQQDEAAEYLARLQSRVLRQVSIEAQVIEIELNENHAAGVDWSEIAQSEGFSWLQSMSSGFSQAASQSGSVLQYTGSDSASNTRVLVTLLEEYGDVRVISAPRVVALNNQPSVLSVVENKVYFSSSVKRKSSSDESTVTESVETAIHTVPVGLVMQVTPQVAVGGDVVMSIRPTISRVSGYVNDPNPSLAAAGVVSRIPEIQVRELETVLRVRGGETVVLGGMMQLRNSLDRQNVPWLHKLPAIGSLFRSRQKAMHQAELLVLLTPTVMSPGEPR